MVEKIVNNAYEEAETLRYLLEKIIAKFNVRINLSDIAGIRKINNQIEDVFRQYSYHNNSFCNHIKKDEALHGLCIKSKNVLAKGSRDPFMENAIWASMSFIIQYGIRINLLH